MAKPGKIWLATGDQWQRQFEQDDSLITRLKTIWKSESHPWEPQSDWVYILTLGRVGYDPSSAPAHPPFQGKDIVLKKDQYVLYYMIQKHNNQAGNRKMSENTQDVPLIKE